MIHKIIVSKVEEVCFPKAILCLCSVTNIILFCLKGKTIYNISELTFAMTLKLQVFFFCHKVIGGKKDDPGISLVRWYHHVAAVG